MKKIFVIDWWLVVIFAVVAISGFGMHISGHRSIHEVWLAVHGANSEIGLFHYRIGILLTIIGLGHIFKRLKTLRKSITK